MFGSVSEWPKIALAKLPKNDEYKFHIWITIHSFNLFLSFQMVFPFESGILCLCVRVCVTAYRYVLAQNIFAEQRSRDEPLLQELISLQRREMWRKCLKQHQKALKDSKELTHITLFHFLFRLVFFEPKSKWRSLVLFWPATAVCSISSLGIYFRANVNKSV